MDRREKPICFIGEKIIIKKEILTGCDRWDGLFIAMMAVTMLAVRAYRIREIIQILFIGYSFFRMNTSKRFIKEILVSRYLFLLWCAVSCMWALYPTVTILYMPSIIQSTLLMISAVLYFSQESISHLRLGVCMFILMTVVLTIYVFLTVPVMDLIKGKVVLEERITARGINANQVGVCCSYSILILLYYLRRIPLRHEILLGAPMLCVALLTGSKKALLTLVIGVLLLAIIKADNIIKAVKYITLSIIALAGVMWAIYHIEFLYQIVGERVDGMLEYLLDGTGDKSTYSRGAMITHAIQLFLEHPMTGIGLHNFKQVNVYGVYAHNNYVELLACIGLPGFVLYYAVVFKALFLSLSKVRSKNRILGFLFVMTVCFLANEYATVSYSNEVIQLVLAIILGYASFWTQ